MKIEWREEQASVSSGTAKNRAMKHDGWRKVPFWKSSKEAKAFFFFYMMEEQIMHDIF